MNTEKLIATLNALEIPRGYQMHDVELNAILESTEGNILRCIILATRYGFLKGQRAERKRAKDAFLKEMEKHAPCYGLLTGLIAKHMSDEYFILHVASYARTLDRTLRIHDGEKNPPP